MITHKNLRIASSAIRRIVERLRHRHGFGIHSPFGYRLVTDALYPARIYRYYGEEEIDSLRLPRPLREHLKSLLRVAAFMGVRVCVTSNRAIPELAEVARLAGFSLVISDNVSDADMLLDFDCSYSPDAIRNFLEIEGRTVWRGLCPDDKCPNLPGDMILIFKDSYLAFSRPGMARTVYYI